jgi:hypothetical protein
VASPLQPAPAPAQAASQTVPATPPAAAPATPAPTNPAPTTPAPAVPAPAPPARPAPANPVPGGPKGVYRTLDEATAALERDPEGALVFLDKTLAVEPDNERAHAFRIVALYDLKRYPAAVRAIRDAREAGYPLWPLALKHPPLRQMLERDNKDPHLPRRKPAAPAPAPAPDPAP